MKQDTQSKVQGTEYVFDYYKTKGVIERPIPAELIKSRSAGFGRELEYVSGATVISLLNEAFDYRWSFEILEEKLVKSEPKLNKKTNAYEDQPPYIQIRGRLTIPALGVTKEQFGTKILLGGASEQEGAAKSAGTDALKKCATLVGIGLDLYKDDAPEAEQTNQNKSSYNNSYKNNYKQNDVKTYSTYTKQKQAPQAQTQPVKKWADVPENVMRVFNEVKTLNGIGDKKEDLVPYAEKFTGTTGITSENVWAYITPYNIESFNVFLQNEAKAKLG